MAPTQLTRRNFITKATLAAIGITGGLPLTAWANLAQARSLRFYHTHTREALEITYAKGDQYDSKALNRVNDYLRDFRTGEQYPIDTGLLDILWRLQGALGSNGVFEVISAFRSSETNAYLRKSSTGVAKRSLHMLGRAIDVRLSDTDTASLQRCAIGMQCGGVGYYAKSNFVHLDTGRWRSW